MALSVPTGPPLRPLPSRSPLCLPLGVAPCPPVPSQPLLPLARRPLPGHLFSLRFLPLCGLARTPETEVPQRLRDGSQVCSRSPGSSWELHAHCCLHNAPIWGLRAKAPRLWRAHDGPLALNLRLLPAQGAPLREKLLLASKAARGPVSAFSAFPVVTPSRCHPLSQDHGHSFLTDLRIPHSPPSSPLSTPQPQWAVPSANLAVAHTRKPSLHGPRFVWFISLLRPATRPCTELIPRLEMLCPPSRPFSHRIAAEIAFLEGVLRVPPYWAQPPTHTPRIVLRSCWQGYNL